MASQKINWSEKTALVTGASSGIGSASARRLARAGLRVILTARRAERLQNLAEEIRAAGGQARVLTIDLTNEQARRDLAEQAGPVDVLVNNAGFGFFGRFSGMPANLARDLINLNITATADLTHLMLPGMLARGWGRIVNMGSMVGAFPNQGIAVYSGSKAFVDSFTISLRRELHGSGVQIGVIRPGPVKTEFFDVSEKLEGGRRVPSEGMAVPPEAVAEAVWSMVRRPRAVIYVPWILGVTPWIELLFGRLIDLAGPILLR